LIISTKETKTVFLWKCFKWSEMWFKWIINVK